MFVRGDTKQSPNYRAFDSMKKNIFSQTETKEDAFYCRKVSIY